MLRLNQDEKNFQQRITAHQLKQVLVAKKKCLFKNLKKFCYNKYIIKSIKSSFIIILKILKLLLFAFINIRVLQKKFLYIIEKYFTFRKTQL